MEQKQTATLNRGRRIESMSIYMRSTLIYFYQPVAYIGLYHTNTLEVAATSFVEATKLPHLCWPLANKTSHLQHKLLLFFQGCICSYRITPKQGDGCIIAVSLSLQELTFDLCSDGEYSFEVSTSPIPISKQYFPINFHPGGGNTVFLLQLHMMCRGPQLLVSEMMVRSL